MGKVLRLDPPCLVSPEGAGAVLKDLENKVRHRAGGWREQGGGRPRRAAIPRGSGTSTARVVARTAMRAVT